MFLFYHTGSICNYLLFYILFEASVMLDPEPSVVADILLRHVPLVLEPGRGVASLCRQELLQRLVERQQHRRVLAQLEPARTPVGCQVNSPLSFNEQTVPDYAK